MSSVWAVVPAAGSGRRMAAEIPKQYLKLNGVPILEHTLRALLACPDIRGVVVVLDPSDRRADAIPSLSDPRVSTAAGGLNVQIPYWPVYRRLPLIRVITIGCWFTMRHGRVFRLQSCIR